jgi:GPH family glycoside/pentoside/hexuronide:cation symporter
MFEKKKEDTYFPLKEAFKATFLNKSYLMVAIAQAMRFFGTGVLQMGMLFYMKYSLKVDESNSTYIFAIAFILAAILLYPWRALVANRFDSRTTLIIANAVMIIGVIPLGLGTSLTMAIIAAVIIGIGLSGLVLIGDVIVAEVVDEDELKVGHQRAGMYFGMTGLLITLSGMLVSGIFALIMANYGYDTLLETQPATVDTGFRLFLTIPPIIGFLLAILALYFYPLHGERLKEIRQKLAEKNKTKAIAAEGK